MIHASEINRQLRDEMGVLLSCITKPLKINKQAINGPRILSCFLREAKVKPPHHKVAARFVITTDCVRRKLNLIFLSISCSLLGVELLLAIPIEDNFPDTGGLSPILVPIA